MTDARKDETYEYRNRVGESQYHDTEENPNVPIREGVCSQAGEDYD